MNYELISRECGKALEYIRSEGKITNRKYRELNAVSDEWSRKELKELVLKKIISVQGRGRSVSYVLKKGKK